MEWYIAGVLAFAALIILVTTGLPIAVSLGLTSLVGLFLYQGLNFGLSALGMVVWGTWDNYILIAVPLFILMAELLHYTAVGENLFDMGDKWMGALPGGLAIASIFACTVFATLCGTGIAGAVVIGLIAIPEMLKRGYDKSLATGAVAAGGGLAHLIPPSLLMIIYATLAEESIGQLFMAGVIPGIILASFYMLFIMIRCIRNPRLAPRARGVSWKERGLVLKKALPATVLLLLVLGTIYTGVCTPTEAAGAGAFGALCLAIASRKLTLNKLKRATLSTAQTTCFIMFILAGGALFSFLLTALQVPQQLMAFVTALPIPPLVVIILIQIGYIGLGMFLDGASMLVISMPMVLPLLHAFRFDPIWFGILVCINVEMATITPPLGLIIYAVKGIAPADVSLEDIIRGALPFMLCDASCLALILFFPQLALWLPSTMVR